MIVVWVNLIVLKNLMVGSLLGALFVTAVASESNSPTGEWLTEDKNGVVEIFSCQDNTMCGRLLWLRIPTEANNKDALDIRNPVPELRNRPLCGLQMMGSFATTGDSTWSGGWLYDPESGHTYKGNITLRRDGTLLLRGFVLVPLFGESQIWTRFNGTVPHCPSD